MRAPARMWGFAGRGEGAAAGPDGDGGRRTAHSAVAPALHPAGVRRPPCAGPAGPRPRRSPRCPSPARPERRGAGPGRGGGGMRMRAQAPGPVVAARRLRRTATPRTTETPGRKLRPGGYPRATRRPGPDDGGRRLGRAARGGARRHRGAGPRGDAGLIIRPARAPGAPARRPATGWPRAASGLAASRASASMPPRSPGVLSSLLTSAFRNTEAGEAGHRSAHAEGCPLMPHRRISADRVGGRPARRRPQAARPRSVKISGPSGRRAVGAEGGAHGGAVSKSRRALKPAPWRGR
jgi:hypothetical protein